MDVRTQSRGARYSNDIVSSAQFSILVPTYFDDPSQLVEALANCEGAENAHLVIYDDGSCEEALLSVMKRCVFSWPGPATLIVAEQNNGRAHARNQLINEAQTDWILFLDADMLPDGPDFLSRYTEAATELTTPALIAGGFSLDQVTPKPSQRLHAAQSRLSECLSADVRSLEPGRYVFTSNILVHREVLDAVNFDDGFAGWGWEDTDWGLRVAKVYPIVHIDNTATHLGLDDTDTLIRKFGSSGPNFARLVERNPADTKSMPLTKVARKLKSLPGRQVIRSISKAVAKSALPASLRLKALKLYRAASYAEHLQ